MEVFELKYIYPAIFTPTDDVPGYVVEFPDDESIFTSGEDLLEAVEMAEDVLPFTLMDYEDDGTPIPKASDIRDIKLDDPKSFVTLIKADTDEYIKMLARMKENGAD